MSSPSLLTPVDKLALGDRFGLLLGKYAPWLALFLSLGCTLAFWRLSVENERQHTQAVFANRAGEMVSRITRRMHDDQQVLLGALGLFHARGTVTRQEWQRYVATLRMEQNFPGVQGVGYSIWLSPAEKEPFVQSVRAEGFPEFNIRPAGERPFYTSIVYLEPFDWRNQRAFGYDMYSEPVRRSAMQRACDSGVTALSERVILVQETEQETQNGVLMLLPVYRAGLSTDTVEERRAALQGFVYSPIRVGNLVVHTLGSLPKDMDLEIRDLDSEVPLFTSFGDAGKAPPRKAAFGHVQTAELLGQRWVFSFQSRPGFAANNGQRQSLFVALFGVATSILLTVIVFILRSRRQSAIALAMRMVERLEVSEDRYRTLFEQSPDGLVIIDPETARFRSFNTAAHRQLGYTREQFSRLTIMDVEALETAAQIKEHIATVLREGRADFFTQQRTSRGELRHVHVTALLIDVSGQHIYQCTWRDVTDQRRAEEALREAHERLRLLGDNLPNGYVYQMARSPEGTHRFTYVSAGVEQVHGVGAAAVLQDPWTLFSLILEEDRAPWAEKEDHSYRSLSRFSAEVRVRSRTDQVQWLQLTSAPRRLPDGTVVWDGLALDVTERKQAEADRLVLSKLESTGILAGGIAHDFNNLLTIILLAVEMAQSENSPREVVRENLQEVRKATQAAHVLTQELITFAEGGNPLRCLTDIEALVRDISRATLSGSAVSCQVSVAETLWPVELDKSQMTHVIRNLVLNAREAMPSGGVLSLTLSNVSHASAGTPALPPGDFVMLSVVDEGVGIPADVLPKIFDPYFSTKQRGETKGVGLGLTICHSIVHRHGGLITVDSVPGRGTTVSVCLPASRQLAAASVFLGTPTPGASGGSRLLVMDDEYSIRRIVGMAAEQMGFSVAQAADGREALALYVQARAEGRPFTLVLLDVMVLEGMGGVETLRGLRALDPSVRAIVMSGYANSEALQNYAQHGFLGRLEKPFDYEDLQSILTQFRQP